MKVWIVAKVYSKKYKWIHHGFTEEKYHVRLFPQEDFFPLPLPFEVGEIWDLNFHAQPKLFLPHVENKIVDTWQFIGHEPGLKEFLMERVKPWNGNPNQLFNGVLESGLPVNNVLKADMKIAGLFVVEGRHVPARSMGYWLPDASLSLYEKGSFITYASYGYHIDYTGFAGKIPEIPEQTLIHVSLKPWWLPSKPLYNFNTILDREVPLNVQKRSYLEISGWYL